MSSSPSESLNVCRDVWYTNRVSQQFLSSPRQPEYVSAPEPDVDYMQVETTRLTPAERQCRQGLCLYRGAKGHVINHCLISPPCAVVSFVNNINSKLLPLPLFVLLLLTSPFQSMPSLTVGQPAISFLGSSAITSRSRRNARGVLQGSLNNWKTTQPGSSTPLCWTSTTTSGSPSCREHRTLVSGEFHWQHRHWTAFAYPTVGHRRSPEVG